MSTPTTAPRPGPGIAMPSGPRRRHPAGPAGPAPRGPAGARPRPGTSLPHGASLLPFVRAFAALYLEVECGRRGRRQLRPLLTERLYATLERDRVRPGPPGVVRAVAGASVGPGAFEAVAVVGHGGRASALAIRLEREPRSGGRWRIVRVDRPEDGRREPPAWWTDAEDPAIEDDLDCAVRTAVG